MAPAAKERLTVCYEEDEESGLEEAGRRGAVLQWLKREGERKRELAFTAV